MKSTFTILKEFTRVFIGLIIFSYGVHLIIAADIGVAPWDCLGQGIANHSSFNYGIAMTLVRGILQLKGFSAILVCCLMIVVGMIFMSFGQVFYINAGETCGPRDTLMVGLGKRFPGVSIGVVQNTILLLVLLVGWALGGSVGIGTIVNVLFVGLIMNAVFKMMKFDPRMVRHRSIIEATRMLFIPDGN